MSSSCSPAVTSTPSTTYNEIIEDTPIVVTTTIAAKRLLSENYAYKYVLQYGIRIRSMGTATYVGFGDDKAQNTRLLAADQKITWQGNRYEVVDLTKMWVVCDTADATVEVTCTYLPQKMYGQVKRVT